MLNKETKNQYRSELFRHLDGLVTAPVAFCFKNSGICDFILSNGSATVEQISTQFKANPGYLNIGLRVLASQGWISYKNNHESIVVAANDKSKSAFELFSLYEDVIQLLHFSGKFHPRKFEIEPFNKLEKIFKKYEKHYGLDPSIIEDTDSIEYQILKHIEGHLAGPTIVRLGMSGMFHKYFMDASFSADEFHENVDCFETILDFLTGLGWFSKKGNHYSFEDKGLFFAKRASAYGVTVSYMPMFRMIEDLMFGNANILWEVPEGKAEKHVDREMNVWGSGGAHSAYFKKIDDIVRNVFDRPIDEQPKGIVDMGCGNGAFLIHLFELIEKDTKRGKMLDEYPLFLVGADFNKAALKVTRANLIQADIWAKVVWGDISDPKKLNEDLQENYGIALKDLLSVRTFLDHNRIWSEPHSQLKENSESSGAFSYRGKLLSPTDVERNLKDHFSEWAPFIEKFGLIIIELHTIAPELTAANLGKTAATAYDATHGFSDQYILEIDSVKKVLAELGLKTDELTFSKFPNSDLATVSINYILSNAK